tara:strand:+ start:19942 stop:20061 length:120 start_codon:yes stop_codon:yes gene_type:complete
MKNALKILAMMCLIAFLSVNALILLVLYVKWVSKLMGAL